MWRANCALCLRLLERGRIRAWDSCQPRFCSNDAPESSAPLSPKANTSLRTKTEKQKRRQQKQSLILATPENVITIVSNDEVTYLQLRIIVKWTVLIWAFNRMQRIKKLDGARKIRYNTVPQQFLEQRKVCFPVVYLILEKCKKVSVIFAVFLVSGNIRYLWYVFILQIPACLSHCPIVQNT